MLEECPHCYTGVFPSASGECPSCRKNIKDLAGADPSRTSLTVFEALTLPPYCCDCDKPTERVVHVKSRIPGQGPGGNESWIRVVFWAFMALISPLLAVFAAAGDDQRRGRSGETLKVRLPQCELCGEAGAPKPIRVDRERSALTFVVHVDFKRRVTPV